MTFFSILKEIPNLQKHFFLEDWDFHSVNTHKLHGEVLLQFNGNSWCNLFFLAKNDTIVHYNKFPKLGVPLGFLSKIAKNP